MRELLYPVTLGWYIGIKSEVPMYDPQEAPCPFCGVEWQDGDVRTFNMVAEDRKLTISFFYRTHKTCHKKATEAGRNELDDYVMNSIEMLRTIPNKDLGADNE